jgi:deazaflavin-dependent oxidoreductase (nitroreductase family)
MVMHHPHNRMAVRWSAVTAPESRRAPGWLTWLNRVTLTLLRRGIGPPGQYILAVPGRRTGVPRGTPVAVLEFDGGRYVVAGYAGSDWVRNARHAGRAELHRGGHREAVVLTEVPVGGRGPILRAFATRVRGGRSFLTVSPGATDAEFAAAGPRHPVFEVRPAQADTGSDDAVS